MPDPQTTQTGLVPPPEYADRQYHWIEIEAGRPHVAAWYPAGWWEVLGRKGESPDYMHDYGWRYVAPCQRPDDAALVKEIERLKATVAYYANPSNWRDGDVPGHIYAIDDDGCFARETLGFPARPANEFAVAYACRDLERKAMRYG